MKLRVAPRGTMRTLLDDATGKPPTTRLFGCRVDRVVHADKTYVHLHVDADDVLEAVDARVRKEQKNLRFSPLAAAGRRLVVKVPAAARYEGADGEPCARWDLAPGMAVDVEVRLGAFGAFGYCWLLARLKPSSPATG